MEVRNYTLQNVAVYIDYENVHKCLLKKNKNAIRIGFFEKLRLWSAQKGKRIVKIAVYCNYDIQDLYESYHQSLLQSYGVETIHTSNQGKNYADLNLTIDVLNSMYSNNNIDEYYIMSNDKDMTPLLNTIRANKRSVSIITTGEEYNPSICAFADNHITIDEIVSLKTENLNITNIANSYWDKMLAFIRSNCDKVGTSREFNHYAYEYALTNEMKYLNLMKYELDNIICDFYQEGKILFYNYQYNNREHVALLPVELKELCLKKGIILKNNIIEDFDIQTHVKNTYAQYRKD